jgi:SAP domain-containing ribonucleoprotein
MKDIPATDKTEEQKIKERASRFGTFHVRYM